MVNDMLKRVVVGAILILFFISVLLLGGWYQCAAFSLAALMSAYELCRALRQSERKVFAAPAYVLAASYCAVYRLLGSRALLLLWLACALSFAASAYSIPGAPRRIRCWGCRC